MKISAQVGECHNSCLCSEHSRNPAFVSIAGSASQHSLAADGMRSTTPTHPSPLLLLGRLDEGLDPLGSS